MSEIESTEVSLIHTLSSYPPRSVYQMSKLRSKYLILEVFGYSGHAQSRNKFIGRINHNLRDLLIRNYSIIHRIVKYRPAINHGHASIISESTVYEGNDKYIGWLANHKEGQHILIGSQNELRNV